MTVQFIPSAQGSSTNEAAEPSAYPIVLGDQRPVPLIYDIIYSNIGTFVLPPFPQSVTVAAISISWRVKVIL